MAKQNELILCVSSVRTTFNSPMASSEEKISSLKSLHEIIKDREIKSIFYEEFYFETLTFLVSILHFEAVQKDYGIFNIISDFLKHGPSDQSFLILIKSIKKYSYADIKFHKLSILLAFLIKNRCILKHMKELCVKIKKENYEYFQQEMSSFVQQVVSTPVILSNIYQNNPFMEEFYPINYFATLSNNVFSTLEFIKISMSQSKDSSILPVSMLIGKLCMSGYGRIFWKTILKNISEDLLKCYLWKKIFNQIFNKLEDYVFPASIESLVFELQSPRKFYFCFGDISKDPKFSNIFLNKFILNHYHSDLTPLKNIILYTSSSAENHQIFFNHFTKMLEYWSNKSLIKFRSFEQSFYISQGIMLSVSVIKKNPSLMENVKESVDKALLEGLPHYLGASLDDVRQMGMVVGVTLAALVPRKDIKLELPYRDCDVTRKLLSLLTSDESNEFENNKATEKNENEIKIDEIKEKRDENLFEEDIDSDDDLVPINSLSKAKSKKKPSYLGQCLEGLVTTEDSELFEECLRCCEDLIEKNKEVKALHREMCGVLLRMEDHFAVEDFFMLRMKCMLKLLVVSPGIIAEYLSGEFYAPNYNLRHRCDILDILVQGAQILSSIKADDQVNEMEAITYEGINVMSLDPFKASEKSVSKENQNEENSNWRKIVAERIEKKTRRFSERSGNRKVVVSTNRFASVAGWFFYPLMRNFDRADASISVEGTDHLVLEKLLISLGKILYNAHNILTADKMVKSLLQFTTCFHRHGEVGVRRGVLGCVWACVFVLGGSMVVDDVADELEMASEWLQNMQINECDSINIDLINNLLPLVNRLKLNIF